jgi:hypothetical protein
MLARAMKNPGRAGTKWIALLALADACAATPPQPTRMEPVVTAPQDVRVERRRQAEPESATAHNADGAQVGLTPPKHPPTTDSERQFCIASLLLLDALTRTFNLNWWRCQ